MTDPAVLRLVSMAAQHLPIDTHDAQAERVVDLCERTASGVQGGNATRPHLTDAACMCGPALGCWTCAAWQCIYRRVMQRRRDRALDRQRK